eukprot:CAMPEP_0171449338 /NCGR_PEP_ID=MMETSP0881-20121228/40070_1 /TAXON_ID=67004 /ORGANISM="Thalassiosira weissflogii, Strain CCMP1336" /LENGTH=236 /DNA_ID=CAMNT_0011973777 /DNA_START=92 /DNA_END=799 /DNA_ORIENTATION=+
MSPPRRSDHGSDRDDDDDDDDDYHYNDNDNEDVPSVLFHDAPPPISPSDDDDLADPPARGERIDRGRRNDDEKKRRRRRGAAVPSSAPPFSCSSFVPFVVVVVVAVILFRFPTATCANRPRRANDRRCVAFAPSSPRCEGTEPLRLALTEEFIKLKSKLDGTHGKGGNVDDVNDAYDRNSNNSYNNYDGNGDGEPIKYFGDANDDGGINLAINGAPNIISTSEKPFTDQLGYSALS